MITRATPWELVEPWSLLLNMDGSYSVVLPPDQLGGLLVRTPAGVGRHHPPAGYMVAVAEPTLAEAVRILMTSFTVEVLDG